MEINAYAIFKKGNKRPVRKNNGSLEIYSGKPVVNDKYEVKRIKIVI